MSDAKVKKRKKLYEGKAKIIYETDNANQLIQEFKDDAPAVNGKKTGQIPNKGTVNNMVSGQLFRYISSYNIPSHYISTFGANAMVVQNLDMIPVKVVVRNIAAGSLLKKMKIKEGEALESPLVEFYLKSDSNNDTQLAEEDLLNNNHCTADELELIGRLALKVNAVLRSFFERRAIRLVDFTLEFGRDKDNKVVLGDEISPDTCRFWDAESNDKLDKDRFSKDIDKVEDAYEEIRKRVFLENTY